MRELFDYLDCAVSPYHAVYEAAEKLVTHGFTRLEETDEWKLHPGGRYYVTRNQSSIAAFVLPKETPQYYHLSVSHSDSPTFRIKKYRTECKNYAGVEVEGYGGMIMPSWLDRPLSFAGRAIVRTGDGVCSRLVAVHKDLFVIPNLAIHFNRDINKGYNYNPQIDLQPIYGDEGNDLAKVAAGEVSCLPEDVLDTDLTLYVRQPAVYVGVNREFFMSPRIDDLACAYTTLCGFLESEKPGRAARFWCMLDNEEVGSGTRQGALGNFLPEILTRVEASFGVSDEKRAGIRGRSLLISADNAHACHPNFPSKSDAEFPVILNKGIVIKYNASQKYTTTGLTAAVFAELCRQNKIPVQRFANRADMPGGSTLGNLLSHQLSIPMLDIGLPQLAMHSAVETAGCRDVELMIHAIRAFYDSSIRQEGDGNWLL